MASGASMEETESWVLSLLFLIFIILVFLVEKLLHRLEHSLKHNSHTGGLLGAVEKVKEEFMMMGIISLMLVVFDVPISHLCHTPDNMGVNEGIPLRRTECLAIPSNLPPLDGAAYAANATAHRLIRQLGGGAKGDPSVLRGDCTAEQIPFVSPWGSASQFLSGASPDVCVALDLVLLVSSPQPHRRRYFRSVGGRRRCRAAPVAQPCPLLLRASACHHPLPPTLTAHAACCTGGAARGAPQA